MRFGELLRERLGWWLDFQLIGNVLELGRKSGNLPLMVESCRLSCCYIFTVRFTRSLCPRRHRFVSVDSG